MDLFKLSNNELSPIDHDAFLLEKDIQTLVENNLETLFDLQFVSSEFTIDTFRLDTLCFDAETNSFVIIEYKKGSSYSVIDQGYSYLSVMLNNKAEFILEYNEKQDKTLKRDGIDWSASRVIFISPAFNTYQKNSVNFKDVPFELWEIKKFKGGLITLEKHQSSSKESIGSVTGNDTNSVISKVSSEVRVQREEDHVAKLSEKSVRVWSELRDRLEVLSDTTFHPTKGYISCKKDNSVVAFIHFHKNHLNVEVSRGNISAASVKSKGFFTLDDPKNVAIEKNWTHKNGVTGHLYQIKISSLDDLEYSMYLLKQKYEKL